MIIRMLTKVTILLFIMSFKLTINNSYAEEMVIGEERVKPGIIFIFEAAVKDTIYPKHHNLGESETDIHIEARANWDTKNIPKGTPAEGFVPYLYITAEIANTNRKRKYKTFIDLLPHINLIDNFHYARNVSLPGRKSDKYNVKFNISSATGKILHFHMDWAKKYSKHLMKDQTFEYKNLSFRKIASASRR